MVLLRPLRPVLRAIEGLLDRAVCLLGAVFFSQAPEFMQQYVQRLGGHLDEARRQLEQFTQIASQAGLTVGQWAGVLAGSANPPVSRLGLVVREASARVNVLARDEAAIRGAGVFARPFVFLRHLDPGIFRGTWRVFRPAVPTTAEGAAYALAGLVLVVVFYHAAVRYPIRRAWRSRRKRRLVPEREETNARA
ncbi:MAG: DUF2937 family protein [Opitutaceae bacterium]